MYCDESNDDGPYYGNFYGGALVDSLHLDNVIAILDKKKRDLGIDGEVKWTKTTPYNLQQYQALMETFFDLIESGQIKVRIMFTHRRFKPIGLTREQKRDGYWLLYYQFIKHAFGLRYSSSTRQQTHLRLFFDAMPGGFRDRNEFKAFIYGLQHQLEFLHSGIRIRLDDIKLDTESEKHTILQCTDVVLGAMHFRLNDFHLAKPSGQRIRGKKTRAKEALYKTIHARINGIYPHFNIGETTGVRGDHTNRWRDPYRHWKFIPTNSEIDDGAVKPKKR